MADRKMLSSDFVSLKARIKNEVLRRNKSGSVASYGGTDYDYSVVPTNGGAVKGEHLKKILDPMKAINDTGLPNYPGELTKAGIDEMEAKVTAWEARGYNGTSSDCKSGCTGMCAAACGTGCSGGCSSSCGGCGSGCTGGCLYGCTDACEGCGRACSNGCDGSCTATCRGRCGDTSGGCIGCGTSCAVSSS